MKRNYDYAQDYIKARAALRVKAIAVMKSYGSVLDLLEIGKKRIIEANGYKDESEMYDDDLDCWRYDNLYYCAFEDKYETICSAMITKVRYNKENNDVDAFVHSDDGFVHEWRPISQIGFESDSVYLTVLEFIN